MSVIKSASALALLAVVASSIGCAAPTSEEDASGGAEAVTIGSRFRDPLVPGRYDGDNITLRVFNFGLVQRVTADFSGAYDRPCLDVSIDITDQGKHIKSDECDLWITAKGGDVTIKGAAHGNLYAETLTHRAKNALAGTYLAALEPGAYFTITSSDDDSFQFDYTSAGGERVEKQTAIAPNTVTGATDHFESSGNCSGSALIYRYGGRFAAIPSMRCGTDTMAAVYVWSISPANL